MADPILDLDIQEPRRTIKVDGEFFDIKSRFEFDIVEDFDLRDEIQAARGTIASKEDAMALAGKLDALLRQIVINPEPLISKLRAVQKMQVIQAFLLQDVIPATPAGAGPKASESFPDSSDSTAAH